MTITAENYPLSTPGGDIIPFDVGFPYGLLIQPIAVAASAAIELPADTVLAVLHASCDCVVSFGDASPSVAAVLTEGVFLEDSVFLPSGAATAIKVPALFFSCISADGASTGKLRISLFRPWQSLGKDLLGSYM